MKKLNYLDTLEIIDKHSLIKINGGTSVNNESNETSLLDDSFGEWWA